VTDDPLHPKPIAPGGDAQAEARAVEAAAIRRRWITLGEALAVLAVVISGLTLWNSWAERSESAASKRAETRQASRRDATLVLTATAASEHKLALKPTSNEQAVQSQTIVFPAALGAAPAQTTGEPRIEAEWFERALEKARGRAGLPDDSRGDERLPVAVTTRFLVGSEAHEDVAIYDIGYTISGHLLSGHSVTLRGLSLVSRATSANAPRLLEARWKTLFPQR
jgi:hypothetical protein